MDEIKLLRQELLHLKDCITKYLGFIFAGIGASVYAMVRLTDGIHYYSAQNNTSQCNLILNTSYFSLTLTNLLTFIAIIFFYKFHSHNRLAGYCKLLSHEIYKSSIDRYNNYLKLFSWEYAVGQLRSLEFIGQLYKILDNLNAKNANSLSRLDLRKIKIEVEKLLKNEHKESLDKSNIFHLPQIKGLRIIVKSLSGNLHVNSWAFPPYIAGICLLICILLYLYSSYSLFQYGLLRDLKLFFYWTISTIFNLVIWNYLLKKLHRLMEGDLTIDSFMMKFFFIRLLFLNSHGYKVDYIEFLHDHNILESLLKRNSNDSLTL